jgi:TolB-like protein
LGTILYELITGKNPFRRDTTAGTMAAIIGTVPEPLPSGTAPGLARVVHRCLHKDPAQRYPSTREPAEDLQKLREARAGKTAGFWLASAAALSIAVLGGWWASSRRPAVPPADRRVVAMRPFKTTSTDSAHDYVTYGIVQDIRDQVSKIGSLRLLSAGAVSRYAAGENKRLAAETGADRIVEGSVRLDQGQIRVDVELIDAKTEQTVWRERFDRKLADVIPMQSEIASRIADALGTSGEQSRMKKRPTDNMAAYDLFLRSRRVPAGPDRFQKVERMLTEAITLDPNFADAMARLANLNAGRIETEGASKAEEALAWANKALAIDPSSEGAYITLADIYWKLGRLASSRAAFQRALELNPNSIGAMDNGSSVAVDLGRFEEALQLSRKALLLSPNVGFVYYHAGAALALFDDPPVLERWLEVYRARFPSDSRLIDIEIYLRLINKRTDEALAIARKRAADQPNNHEARAMLAEVAFLASATDAEALTEPHFRDAPGPRFGNYGLLPQSARTRYAHLLAKRGSAAQARPLLDQAQKAVEALVADGSDSPLAFEELACIAAIRGDTPGALSRYRQAYQAGWRYLLLSRTNPMLEPLRRDPEFQTLLAEMASDVSRMRAESKEVPELLNRTIPFLNTLAAPAPPRR